MIFCARCDAVVEHLIALLGHYQEVHGGVPKPRFRDMEEVREVVPDQTRAKRDPGRCFRKAGWRPCGESKGGLVILEMFPHWAVVQ